MKRLILIFLLVALVLPFSVLAQQENKQEINRVELWFFHSDECPYCQQAKGFLSDLKANFPNLEIRQFEVSSDQSNGAIFNMMIDAYGVEDAGVPTFFIGDYYVSGYNEVISSGIVSAVKECSINKCVSPGVYMNNPDKIEKEAENIDVSWEWIVGGLFVIMMIVAVFIPHKKVDSRGELGIE